MLVSTKWLSDYVNIEGIAAEELGGENYTFWN